MSRKVNLVSRFLQNCIFDKNICLALLLISKLNHIFFILLIKITELLAIMMLSWKDIYSFILYAISKSLILKLI